MPGWFLLMKQSLPKNSPDRKFLWFVFSRIWTEYGDFRSANDCTENLRKKVLNWNADLAVYI